MSRYRQIARWLRIRLLTIGILLSLAPVQNSFAAPGQSQVPSGDSQWAAEERWKELNTHVEDLINQRKYIEAMPLAQKSVELAKSAFGADDSRLAASSNNLAELYRRHGEYGEAEPLFQQALRIDQKVLGLDHPTVAADLNQLAGLYQDQGKYSEAEPLYQQALGIVMKALESYGSFAGACSGDAHRAQVRAGLAIDESFVVKPQTFLNLKCGINFALRTNVSFGIRSDSIVELGGIDFIARQL